MLRVKNWSRFQHYKDRCPPWIKLATDTFQNYDFSRLHDASKLLALCIWTIAARSKDGEVPDDFGYLHSQGCLGSFVKPEHLQELIKTGFIERDSEMLAVREQDACSEREREGEGEERQNSSSGSRFVYPDEFGIVWEQTGRRGLKGNAHKAWVKAGRPSWVDVQSPWRAYLLSQRPIDGFVQDLSTWFNGGGHAQEWPPGKAKFAKPITSESFAVREERSRQERVLDQRADLHFGSEK